MEKLGVGIVGTGWVSGEYIRAFEAEPRTEVRALVSRETERAHAKAEEYGITRARAYDHLEKMLDDPGIQIVVLATPHPLHVSQGVAAAKAGKHIVIEKPVALNLDNLRRLQSAVEAAKIKTVVSFVLRWNPLFKNIRAMLDDGLIGKPFYAEVDYLHGLGPWYAQYDWNIKKEMGGSSLLTAGCHAVDALRWFVRKKAVEVFAYSNTSPENPLRYEYDPNSVTLVRFEDGAIGKVASSIECVMPYVFNIQLLGDQGTIRNDQLFTKRWPEQTGWAKVPSVLPDNGDVSHHPFQDEVRHFVDCILNNSESHATLEDAALTHEICFASEISAREHRPVSLPLA
ncbi:MAG TPA: Gfo/Idh/MocA family oxidoreductase [Terriglobia bacterium]|nr:Gfo/Idh/MocA family oxidoreductase [Terriglobia bacterium]